MNLEMDVLVKAARGGAAWGDLPISNKTANTAGSRDKPTGLTLERLLASGFSGRRLKGQS